MPRVDNLTPPNSYEPDSSTIYEKRANKTHKCLFVPSSEFLVFSSSSKYAIGRSMSSQGQFSNKYPRAISPSLDCGPQRELEIGMIAACWQRFPIDSFVAVKPPCLGRTAADKQRIIQLSRLLYYSMRIYNQSVVV